MSIASDIEQKLSALNPVHLKVENESHKHSVPANSETHFRVEVVSREFDQLRSIKRHQMIYALLKDEMAGPVHALAIHAFAPDEWQGEAPASPDCRGGNGL